MNPMHTDTNIFEGYLRDIDFPAIFKICILPGFDLAELHSVGYDSPRKYFNGDSHFNSSIIGWAGHRENGSTYGTVEEIKERVSTDP